MILDDGSEFPMHHSIHGGKDRLFISRRDGIIVEIRDGLGWKIIGNTTMLRITAKEGEKR